MTRTREFLILSALIAPAALAGDPQAGRQKSAPCQACHGADGNSTGPQFPRLAGQYPDYLVQALMEYKNGERKNPIMAPFAAQLSPRDMEDLAAYFATRPNGLFKRP
ncbi:MAG: c-type cytochrome [Sulfurifustis sp.]